MLSKLFLSFSFFFSSSFSSVTSASTSMFTSALPILRQALRQLPHAVGTAGPQLQGSERPGNRWTSIWDPPSSTSTTGPQPGTFRVQWAPLDLNLGPFELSKHRWTSTWDRPSSVSTAGPQPGTLRAQWALLDLNGQIKYQKIFQIKYQKICQIKYKIKYYKIY